MRCWSCSAVVAGPGPCPTCGAVQSGQPSRSLAVRPQGRVPVSASRPAGLLVPSAQAPGLGGVVRGAVAPTGMRLGSFSIDATVVLLLAAAVAMLTWSVALTSVVVVEAVVVLVVWEARTGLTVGNAVLRLRTARDDRPWSPGAVRELVRAAVVGAGALAGAFGAWVVVGSGGLDRTRRGRTWADRAAKTVVVRVTGAVQPVGEYETYEPPHAVTVHRPRPVPSMSGPVKPSLAVPAPVVPAPVVLAPAAVPASAAPGRVPSGPVTVGPVPSGPSGPVVPRSRRLMVGGPPGAPTAPRPVASPPVAPRPVPPFGAQPPTPAVRPAAPPAVPPTSAVPTAPTSLLPKPAATPLTRPDVTVLLVFDTGQRDHLPFGTSAVLGRDPVPRVPTDRAIVVRDDEGTVSKNHLRVEYAPDGVWLTDLGSTNGTGLLVDGVTVPLAPGARTRIDGVVRVAVGHRVLMVSYLVQGGRP